LVNQAQPDGMLRLKVRLRVENHRRQILPS
jgi:hypothetical protein